MSSPPPQNQNRPADRSVSQEDRLRDAMRVQRDAIESGQDGSTKGILKTFSDLAKRPSAVLRLICQEYENASPNKRGDLRRKLFADFPEHQGALQRQIEWVTLLNSMRPGKATRRFSILDDGQNGGQRYDANHALDGDSRRKDTDFADGFDFVDGCIGRFEIQHVIGHGGMGSVYLANDTMAGREVAIKIPRYRTPAKSTGHAGPFEDSLREAKIASQLDHPHVVDLYEVGTWNDGCYFVSRFADAGDLASWIAEHPGPFPVDQVMPLLQTLAQTIAYCHRSGVCHLDLKPANILFTTDADSTQRWKGFPGKPLITDFGIARMKGMEETSDHSSVMMGTPMYLSPEQSSCHLDELTPAADVFSFGVMAYELLTGGLPFAAATPIAYVDRIRDGQPDPFSDKLNIPVGLQRVCMKCLATEPEDRYPTGEELAEDLHRVQQGQPVLDWKPTRLTTWNRWLRQPARIQQAGLVVLICNFAILAGFIGMIVAKFLSPESVPGTIQMLMVDILKLVSFPHLFLIVGSVMVLRGRYSWQWMNLVLSIMLVGLLLTSIARGESPIRFYNGNTLAFLIAHLVVGMIALIQLGMQIIAIPAHLRFDRENRQP